MVRAHRQPPSAAPALTLASLLIGCIMMGMVSCTRDHHLLPDFPTLTPPIVSTDGWRPMPPPQGWREAFKDRISAPALQENAGFPSSDSSGYSQESVGHPVLNLLQQHLEAAEKKRPQVPSSELFPPSPPSQRGASLRSQVQAQAQLQALHKSEVYAPAPPSILGSFSVFGHATLKARDKAKRKKPISDPYFQSSETRSVYQNQPGGHSFGSSLNLRPSSSGHFPRLRYNSGGNSDLRAEQQQHHTRFFLSPISSGADHTPFGTDTLLVPPQAAETHGAYFSQGAHHPGHGITSYQVQKFGDYDPSFLSQPFSANAHFAEPQVFNSGNLEDTGPAQFQQQQPYPPTNIEFLPEAPVAYPPPRQQEPPAYQPSHLQDDQLTRTPLRSKPQVVTAAPDYAPQEVHVTPQKPFPGRPTEDSRLLTPTPLPDDIAQRHPTGSVFSEYNRFPATPEPLAAGERSPPAQLQPLTTHSHPNGASSVVAFSLGDRPPGAFLDAGAPLLGAPHGERGRITRPYFQEPSRGAQPEFTMTPEPDTSSDANDEEEEEGSEVEAERPQPPTRSRPTPPTATREPFLPTLQPALRQPPFHPHHDAGHPPAPLDATHLPLPASNEVSGVPYAPFPRDQDEQQHPAAHEDEATPAPTAAASAPEDPTALPETSTRLQKPRLRRPGGYRQRYPSAATAPAATEPEPSEQPAEEEGSRPPQRYRRPGSARRPQPYYRRRPTSPASDDGNEVQDVRPQRRPTQRYRQRPNYYADDAQRDNNDYHTSTQYGDTQATRPYRRRRPSTAPPSQHLDDAEHETDADPTLPPYGEHQSVNYEEQPSGTAAPPTTTPRSRRLPNYAGGRNRGKDKYARLPAAARPSAAAATEAPDMMESASEQVEAVISNHNEVVEESAPQPVNHHDEYEAEEEFTTPLPTTSTTPSTTSTTTTTEPPTTASTTTSATTTTTTTPPPLTTTSTTTTPIPEDEVPHATEEASATVTTLSRLRPRLRYNSTRPRFSVRDYRERLNRTPAPTTTSTTTTTEDPFEASRGTYESTRMRLDTSSVAPPSGPAVSVAPQRVRYPARHRGTYQYKRPEEETTNHKEEGQPLTTTEAPARGRFTPGKEKTPGRYGGSRYRSSTTTATPTTAPAEVTTTDKSKASTSRYRPGTGKYFSRYRSTSEQPSQSGTAPSAEGPPAATAPAASAATAKPFVRPKGVFSAVRRPYPLRPPRPGGTRVQPPTAAAPQDNRLDESHGDIDDAASHTAHAVVTPPPTASAASGTGARPPLVLAPKPEENVIEASTLLKKVDEPEHDTESSPSAAIGAAPSRHRSSTASPSSAQSEDASPSKDDDEGTRSTSQRIADLTSAAAFNGGFFKTPASAGFEARRITMATEDPILPIEAFFPIWNNNKDDKSR